MALVIHPESHIDHLPAENVLALLKLFEDKDGFFLETIKVPEEMLCKLRGPIVGDLPIHEDSVTWEQREGRNYNDRIMLKNMTPFYTQDLTVIGGPHAGIDCILYTAYPGPIAPKSLLDPSLEEDKKEEAKSFWATHALEK